jgi:hypothetical protein
MISNQRISASQCASAFRQTQVLQCSGRPKTDGQPAIRASLFPTPPQFSPDLAIAGFYLFGRLKRQLSGRILDNEENLLETITETLSELPKDEVQSAFVHWKERYQWVADHNGEFYPN